MCASMVGLASLARAHLILAARSGRCHTLPHTHRCQRCLWNDVRCGRARTLGLSLAASVADAPSADASFQPQSGNTFAEVSSPSSSARTSRQSQPDPYGSPLRQPHLQLRRINEQGGSVPGSHDRNTGASQGSAGSRGSQLAAGAEQVLRLAPEVPTVPPPLASAACET